MKKIVIIGTLIVTAVSTSLAYCSGGGFESMERSWVSLDVAPIKNETYVNECASCHFGYAPGLLPARSWQKLMSGLSDHFGDNAELDQESYAAVLKYLVENAADKSDYKRSVRINKSLAADETPIRITETAYFKRKHRELSEETIRNIPEIGSYSNCIACHRGAETGSFNEHEIRIPGSFGRWED